MQRVRVGYFQQAFWNGVTIMKIVYQSEGISLGRCNIAICKHNLEDRLQHQLSECLCSALAFCLKYREQGFCCRKRPAYCLPMAFCLVYPFHVLPMTRHTWTNDLSTSIAYCCRVFVSLSTPPLHI